MRVRVLVVDDEPDVEVLFRAPRPALFEVSRQLGCERGTPVS